MWLEHLLSREVLYDDLFTLSSSLLNISEAHFDALTDISPDAQYDTGQTVPSGMTGSWVGIL